jgi:O-antigen biosynthesis protein WbqP
MSQVDSATPANEATRAVHQVGKRLFDAVVALIAFIVLAGPMLIIAIVVAATSRGPVLYWSDRIGRHNAIFSMPKFRSMYVGTPPVATHLLANPDAHITPVGRFLRKSSLDELPQLWSVLVGDMSLVGPRPALFNQDDLIKARTDAGVHVLRPGITGWAQVNGRDELPIPDKVALDADYLRKRSFSLDVRILWMTLWKVVRRDGVSH